MGNSSSSRSNKYKGSQQSTQSGFCYVPRPTTARTTHHNTGTTNRIITDQQRIITQQQRLIAEQIAKQRQQTDQQRPKQLNNVSKPVQSGTFHNNFNNLNQPKKCENKDLGSTSANGRMFGEFKCPKCGRSWKSANAWVGMAQKCSRCLIDVYAKQMLKQDQHREDLCEKCKILGHNCQQKKKF